MKQKMMKPSLQLLLTAALAVALLTGCSSDTVYQTTGGVCQVVPSTTPAQPAAVTYNNSALTTYDELLIIGPHPDDEVLGFAGIAQEFKRLGKPVRIVVVTIGDAYCDACSFWKNVGVEPSMAKWGQCNEADLTVFAGQVRRNESLSAQRVLGGPTPTFWDYPDTGLGTAWAAYNSNTGLDTNLRRSDCTKSAVFGTGSETSLTPRGLYNQLYNLIATASPKTLIGTTHPLDGHPDHTGLGNLVRMVNANLASKNDPNAKPKSVAFTVIHANTTPAGLPDHDAWYPYPGAVDGRCLDPVKQPCYLGDTTLLTRLRDWRYHPDWSFPLPGDISYVDSIPNGVAVPFSLKTSDYQGPTALKLLAVDKFISQQGYLARTGTIPAGMAGLVDCNGYQKGFIRSNEMFVLEAR